MIKALKAIRALFQRNSTEADAQDGAVIWDAARNTDQRLRIFKGRLRLSRPGLLAGLTLATFHLPVSATAAANTVGAPARDVAVGDAPSGAAGFALAGGDCHHEDLSHHIDQTAHHTDIDGPSTHADGAPHQDLNPHIDQDVCPK